jgi:ribulose-phosphate 3-epimerase
MNPETPLSVIEEYMEETEDFLVMSVHPGFSNQKYIPDVEEKIRELRKKKPNANIEVDGGIGPETARRAVTAGANWLASASAIFNRDDVKNAIEEIKKSAKGAALECSKK